MLTKRKLLHNQKFMPIQREPRDIHKISYKEFIFKRRSSDIQINAQMTQKRKITVLIRLAQLL